MRNDIITGEFIQALRDYSYLLNNLYPRKSILKIVGDRYLLNTFQRIMLSRGVFPDSDVRGRIRKTSKTITGKELYIDAYNVLFTICNYLLGRMVFIGNDHFVRDAGEVHGKPYDDPVFSKAVELCMDYLVKMKPSRVEFLIDSPVSHSGELAARLRELIAAGGLKGDALVDKNPDNRLIRQSRGVVVSSDSDILDNTELTVTDLAHLVLRDNFKLNLPDLGKLIA
jgi:hypothetical protein